MKLTVWWIIIIVNILNFFTINKALSADNNPLLSQTLARVNTASRQQVYSANAQFWGLLATGVNQISTVTFYTELNNRLSIGITLPQKCLLIFEITKTIITKVTQYCPDQKIDKSSDYTNWMISHNQMMREIKMIAPSVKLDNPLYIRKQAFWLIKY
ncbi:hypothetical protein [Aphanothece sacrum]|uniref:Electron transporter RnfC n=1 Tax=Aphanothece sacrum FPU1 TaxID=1920663 RepID=A0A401IG24_APHSA|nr:hypothetical protein [Aphanothece sacrum]GBF80140.1 electron transporter RnfC [Aphanothece sacrum FPU1]GBF86387.1 hypothetical protein AsFPU3_3458 [Aphanothece sacrum FPU3]